MRFDRGPVALPIAEIRWPEYPLAENRNMQYDDQVRQFNFMGGLAFGALLGAVLAMALAPRVKRGNKHRLRNAARSLPSRAKEGLGRVGDGVAAPLSSLIEDARERLAR